MVSNAALLAPGGDDGGSDTPAGGKGGSDGDRGLSAASKAARAGEEEEEAAGGGGRAGWRVGVGGVAPDGGCGGCGSLASVPSCGRIAHGPQQTASRVGKQLLPRLRRPDGGRSQLGGSERKRALARNALAERTGRRRVHGRARGCFVAGNRTGQNSYTFCLCSRKSHLNPSYWVLSPI